MSAWIYGRFKNRFPVIQWFEDLTTSTSTLTVLNYYLSYVFPQYGAVCLSVSALHGSIIAASTYRYYKKRKQLTLGEELNGWSFM